MSKGDTWDNVVTEIKENEVFTAGDLVVDVDNAEVKETLNAMEDLGWIRKIGDTWVPGPKARELVK